MSTVLQVGKRKRNRPFDFLLQRPFLPCSVQIEKSSAFAIKGPCSNSHALSAWEFSWYVPAYSYFYLLLFYMRYILFSSSSSFFFLLHAFFFPPPFVWQKQCSSRFVLFSPFLSPFLPCMIYSAFSPSLTIFPCWENCGKERRGRKASSSRGGRCSSTLPPVWWCVAAQAATMMDDPFE